MVRLFHDQTGRRDRMHDPFDRGDGSGFEVGTFHNCRIHPLHSVQLAFGSPSCIEQSRSLERTDCTFDSGEGGTSLRKEAIPGRDRIGQSSGLSPRQTS
jgi:hypothetical protein